MGGGRHGRGHPALVAPHRRHARGPTPVRDRATAVVLAHNHPSGLASPSDEDISTTRYVHDVLRKLDITLYDHVILADDDMVSLRDSGYFLAFY